MAVPFGAGHGWSRLSELIHFFVLMGCIRHDLPTHLEGPDGSHPIRYLYSPKTDDFVSLLHYEDDEFIPPSELQNWERRLGYKLDGSDAD